MNSIQAEQAGSGKISFPWNTRKAAGGGLSVCLQKKGRGSRTETGSRDASSYTMCQSDECDPTDTLAEM
jgi:hypothetical protein